MHAKGRLTSNQIYSGHLFLNYYQLLKPIVTDSGNFDNVLEFLSLTGRPIQEAVLMMIPEAWQRKKHCPRPENLFMNINRPSWNHGMGRLLLYLQMAMQ